MSGAAADPEGQAFLRRIYRGVVVVTGFVLFTLASYRQFWAMPPLLAGAALGLLLLYTFEVFVRRVFTPRRAAEAKNNERAGAGRALLGIGLVKYPLVMAVLWAVVRFWDHRQIAAFVGGFLIIQFVIVCLAIGRAMKKP